MITAIGIENFQSHKKTRLEFCGGVNVIVGSSDSGKSAIMRAFNWVATNRPLGDAFRSDWGGDTMVRVEVEGNKMVSRVKTSTKNLYDLFGGKKSKKLSNLKEMPEEVDKILNLQKVNVQSQMDPPFLLSDTSGQVAKYLNELVNLDEIDSTISNVEKRRRKTKSEADRLQSEIEKNKAELDKYSDLKDREKDISELSEIEFALASQVGGMKKLQSLVESAKRCEEEIKSASKDMPDMGMIKELENVTKELENAIYYAGSLKSLLDSIQQTELEIDDMENNLSYLKGEYEKITPNVCPLCGNEWEGCSD